MTPEIATDEMIAQFKAWLVEKEMVQHRSLTNVHQIAVDVDFVSEIVARMEEAERKLLIAETLNIGYRLELEEEQAQVKVLKTWIEEHGVGCDGG